MQALVILGISFLVIIVVLLTRRFKKGKAETTLDSPANPAGNPPECSIPDY